MEGFSDDVLSCIRPANKVTNLKHGRLSQKTVRVSYTENRLCLKWTTIPEENN